MLAKRLIAITLVVAGTLGLRGVPGAVADPAVPVVPSVHGRGQVACDRAPVELELRSPYLDETGEATLAVAVASATEVLDGVRRRSEPPGVPYTYLLHVPEGLPDGPVPLLVAMHGLGGHGPQFANQSEWTRFAAERGFIVAFPSGNRRWDTTEGSVDVAFIRDVVAEIRSERCIDGRRIFATGHSYGGFMTQRLACDAGDLFAAGAVVSGGNVTMPGLGGPCAAGTGDRTVDGYEPVPLAFWHGTDDGIVSYAQGRKALDGWVGRYACVPLDPGSVVRYGTIEVYGDCARPDIAARDDQPGSDTAEERRGTLPAPVFATPIRVQFRIYEAHGHGYPDGCGGIGELSTAECDDPDETNWPTVDTHAAEVLAFLFDQARIGPAAPQPLPGPVPVPALSDPGAIGPWLMHVVESNRR